MQIESGESVVRKVTWLFLALVLVMALFLGAARAEAQGSDTTVYVLVFYSPSCPHCRAFIMEDIPAFQQAYGNQVVFIGIDATTQNGFELFRTAYTYFGIPENEVAVPVLVCGENVLMGRRPDELDVLIQQGIAAGGVPIPPIPGLAEALGQVQPSATAEPTEQPTPTEAGGEVTPESTPPPGSETGAAAPEIHMAYFYEPGCSDCATVGITIQYIQNLHPNLIVHEFNIEDEEGVLLSEWLGEHFGLPEDQRLTAPAIYIGDDYVLESDITEETLLTLVDRYSATGVSPIWEGWDAERGESVQRLIDEFLSFGTATVFGAGLIDGLNPCAFATLIFFVSYLAFTGRKGAEILLVGGAFTLGVFAIYLLVGFGAIRAIESFDLLDRLGRWVYGITAVMTAVLAVVSFYDFLKARKGEFDEMALKLPTSLRKRINAIIRGGAALPAFAAIALLTGGVVSLIELGCTGQIYLPTIIFVMSRPELRQQAVFQLLVYNIGFIVPLIVVFVLAFLGTGSERMALAVKRHTATVKLITALLFLALTGWLVWVLVA